MRTIEVETSAGTVRGALAGGIATFKGIPYAEPPFGDNLFRPPVRRAAWTGTRDCTAYGARCPQPSSALFTDLPVGEDCLSVNVWAPEGASRLPVLFWIHGGGFLLGSNADPGSDGTSFAHDGVVLVSCNYRLGALGFLHAGHLDHRYSAASGAYGVADQIAALTWTRENIAAFGGDPDNVTIFGASAGATFVDTLLGCSAAQGLFRRAVSQSAAGAPVFGFPEQSAQAAADAMLAELDVTADAIGRSTTAEILAAQTRLMSGVQAGKHPEVGRMTIPFVPMTGGDLLPRAPVDAIAAGVGADVTLLIGTNRDEATLYRLMEEMGAAETGMSPGRWDADHEQQQRVLETYRQAQDPDSPVPADIAMTTDRVFRIPSLRIAEAHLRGGGTALVYQFAWRSPTFEGRAGASHGMEGPFVFDDFSLPITRALTGPAVPPKLVAAVHGAWTSFATAGDPASRGTVPAWPAYNTHTRPTMVFDTITRVVDDPDPVGRAVWDLIDLRLQALG